MAATSVRDAIAGGAAVMAAMIRTGGALHDVAIGSSGLMVAADAQKLDGTIAIPAAQMIALNMLSTLIAAAPSSTVV